MTISISIPGVGPVTAYNAATESTLQAILGQLQAQQGAMMSVNRASNRAWAEVGAQAQQVNQAMTSAANQAQSTAANTSNSYRMLNSIFVDFSETQSLTQSAINMTGRGLRNLSNTLVDIAATLVTSYKSMAQNPVSLGAQMLHTGLQAAADAVGSVGPMIGAAIGARFGAGGSAIGAIVGQIGGGLGQAAAKGLQMINGIMAQEMQGTIQSFQELTGQGAVFANGMTEMRMTAVKSGMTIDQFAASVRRSDQYLRNMGASLAGASQRVVEVSQYFDRDLGGGAGKLRREMLALGYSYEQQYELTAQYLANLQATNTQDQLALMNEKDLAKNTRQYAEDLKVLAAFTKEDAQAAMEAARAKSLEADIMAQLGPEQGQKFQKMLAAMPEYARKGFMEMVSSGGAVVDGATNVAMSQNAEFANLLEGSYARLMDAGTNEQDAMDFVAEQRSVAANMQRELNREQGAAINQAARFTGGLQAQADLINQLSADAFYNPEAVAETRDTTVEAAKAADGLTRNAISLQESSQQFANIMEQSILPYLEPYSDLLKTVNDVTLKVATGTLAFFGGGARSFTNYDVGTGPEVVTESMDYENNAAYLEAAMKKIEYENQGKSEAEINALKEAMRETVYNAMVTGEALPDIVLPPEAFEEVVQGAMMASGSQNMQQIASKVYGMGQKEKAPDALSVQLTDETIAKFSQAQSDTDWVTAFKEWISDSKANAEVQRAFLSQINTSTEATAINTDRFLKDFTGP